jgi:MSHA biogenesis protein MshP
MKKLQQGFSIITAIFLLVVLSFLGVAMVAFSTAQNQSSAMDVLGSRAYQAARTGIEWAAYQVANSNSNAANATVLTNTFAAGTLGGTLTPFTVNVTYTAVSQVEGAATVWIYDVDSAATMGTLGGGNYVERIMRVKLAR